MDKFQEIKQLKESIIKIGFPNKEVLVDRLIELEGMKAMSFFQDVFMIDPYQQNMESSELNNIAGYGVRQLLKLQIVESKSEFKFCPYCKLDLDEYELIDPYMTGLKCKNRHQFHIEVVQDGQCTDKTLKSDKTSPLEIAKDWLTNRSLRNQLQNQIADVLRKYIDMQTAVNNEEERDNVFIYCPICSLNLKKFEQDDVWVEGLKCSNDHTLYSRNGLSYKGTKLEPDISKSTFDFLVNSYLEKDQIDYLPGQIAKLLVAMIAK